MLDANMTKPSLSSGMPRGDISTKRAIAWITVSFIVLGVLLRTIRFGICFPLYGDEGSLAANFLDRDFAGLFQPLDYGQIAPLGFLWAELAVVKLMGFGEYSLRFLPFLASVASVGLFAMLARRLCGDTMATAFSIAVFGVSLVLIRYAAEVKPYSIDLLVSIAILYLAVRVIEGKRETHLLWCLALFVPVAVLFSLPSLFVIAGVLFTVGVQFLLERDRKMIIPSIALALSTLASFALYYVYFLSPHHEYHKDGMTTFWAGAFPPLDNPFHLVWWFADIHTGRLMAYPAGDKNGTSAISFIFFIMGAVALWKEHRR
ncbi:glycosyltransferase family 39 protein, partial [bacterium]|nr:glycosyltransferase family 39 protein [bacterium]